MRVVPLTEVDPRPACDVARSVEVLLGELGGSLDRAFARGRPRRSRRWLAGCAALVLAALAVAGAFVLRDGAVRHRVASSVALPRVAGLVIVGVGSADRWELAIRRCAGQGDALRLTLLTVGGDALTACAAQSTPASAFYDARNDAALAFGVVPAGTTTVSVALSGGGQATFQVLRVNRRLVGTTLPSGEFFVGAIPGTETVTALTAYGAGSRLLEACNQLRCVTP